MLKEKHVDLVMLGFAILYFREQNPLLAIA